MKKAMLGLVAASMMSGAAYAHQEVYMGADFSFVGVELDPLDADPTALRFRGGIELNENFAIEGVVAVGLQDDELGRTGVDIDLDSLFGVSLVGIVPLDRSFSLFAKVGYAKVEYEGSFGGYSDSVDDTGVMFGFGGKMNFSRTAAMTLEYTILPDVDLGGGSEIESDMISLGLQFYF